MDGRSSSSPTASSDGWKVASVAPHISKHNRRRWSRSQTSSIAATARAHNECSTVARAQEITTDSRRPHRVARQRTLNGRRDPAPHPGVDSLRFAPRGPRLAEHPITASGLAGFPEPSPQQIAPDTPASLLRARSLRSLCAQTSWDPVVASSSVVGRVSPVQNVGLLVGRISEDDDVGTRHRAGGLPRWSDLAGNGRMGS